MTLQELSHEVGTDTGNLSRLERGHQGYTDEGLHKLAVALKVDLRDLFTEPTPIQAMNYAIEQFEESLVGESPVQRDQRQAAHATRVGNQYADTVRVPTYDLFSYAGRSSPGSPAAEAFIDHVPLSLYWVARNLPPLITTGQLAGISAPDDAMQPTFSGGDLLLVDGAVTKLQGDGVYVITIGETPLIKRLQQRPDDSIAVNSDNKLYESMVIADEHGKQTLTILARVLWAWKGQRV